MIQTYKEAVTVMQHPRFGDERCIEARDVMRMAARIRILRRGCTPLGNGDKWKPIASMTVKEIENELKILEGLQEEASDAQFERACIAMVKRA